MGAMGPMSVFRVVRWDLDKRQNGGMCDKNAVRFACFVLGLLSALLFFLYNIRSGWRWLAGTHGFTDVVLPRSDRSILCPPLPSPPFSIFAVPVCHPPFRSPRQSVLPCG